MAFSKPFYYQFQMLLLPSMVSLLPVSYAGCLCVVWSASLTLTQCIAPYNEYLLI